MKQLLLFIGGILLFIFIVVGEENFGTALLVIGGIIVIALIIGVSNDKKKQTAASHDRIDRAVALGEKMDRLKEAFIVKFNTPFKPADEDKYPRYIFMDFETTDLPVDYTMPTEEFLEVYPYIIQAAVLVFNEKHELIDQFSSIIKAPSHARFAPKAVEIHGITKSRSMAEGVDIVNLFAFFKQHISGRAVLVAHNIKFDNFMLKLECKRNKIRLPKIKTFCTMIETIDICAIEKQYGRSGYKWPNLKELVFHTYTDKRTIELNINLHDAMTDIKLCAMCFFELKLHKKITEETF